MIMLTPPRKPGMSGKSSHQTRYRAGGTMPQPQAQQQQSAKHFKIGDKAVYPGHGVGEMTGIVHEDIAGQRLSFYELKMLDNGLKIKIPINKVGSVGLRDIIHEKEVKQVYSILKREGASPRWIRPPGTSRYREYTEKIKTGKEVFEIAEVLRDLYLLKFDKGPLVRRAQDVSDTASPRSSSGELSARKELR